MEHLLSKIAKNVRPKTVLGRTINGDMFCSLLESYVDAMNSGGAPEIRSAWTRVVANQCREAQQQALRVHDQLLETAVRTFSSPRSDSGVDKQAAAELGVSALLPVESQVLLECHEKAKAKSKEFFRSQVDFVLLCICLLIYLLEYASLTSLLYCALCYCALYL